MIPEIVAEITDKTETNINHLLYVNNIHFMEIELTTCCNLRCVYCTRDISNVKDKNFDFETVGGIENCVKQLKDLNIKHLKLNGYGETLVHPQWNEVLGHMINAGFQVELITNLAKKLSDKDIKVLSRIFYIRISLDTVEKETAEWLRQGLKLDLLFDNIKRIKAAAESDGRKPPILKWECTLSDKVMYKLSEWVEKGLSLGVNSFEVNSLVESDKSRKHNIRSIYSLSEDELAEAIKQIEMAEQIAKNNNADFFRQYSVRNCINKVMNKQQKIESGNRTINDVNVTRCCTQPWKTFQINSAGYTANCCDLRHSQFNKLNKNGDIKESFNSKEIIELRRSLLQGENLPSRCSNCRLTGLISTDGLRKLVEDYLLETKN
ncbi:MAG: radical SAM protein [Candidatus Gastranaerophilales bacterium]|nr:radical SAM protein [Candidatus Gastranaerophilales bacterium]